MTSCPHDFALAVVTRADPSGAWWFGTRACVGIYVCGHCWAERYVYCPAAGDEEWRNQQEALGSELTASYEIVRRLAGLGTMLDRAMTGRHS